MAQIVNFEEAKKEGKKLGQVLMSQDNAQKIEIQELLEELKGITPTDGDFDYVAHLLSLSEESFQLLAPHFLESLYNTYQITENRLLLARTLTLSNITLQDLYDQKEEMLKVIDDTAGDFFSPAKLSFLKEMVSLTYETLADVDGITKCMIDIPVQLIHSEAKLPAYAHSNDSGMDVYALEDITIKPGETRLIPIGIKVSLPRGYELQVRPKSGRSLKSKLRIANAPGTIDEGYHDEIMVIVENTDQYIKHAEIDENGRLYNIEFGSDITIGKGEKFAQLVLSMVPKVVWRETEAIFDTNDRGGGFGSTGDK